MTLACLWHHILQRYSGIYWLPWQHSLGTVVLWVLPRWPLSLTPGLQQFISYSKVPQLRPLKNKTNLLIRPFVFFRSQTDHVIKANSLYRPLFVSLKVILTSELHCKQVETYTERERERHFTRFQMLEISDNGVDAKRFYLLLYSQALRTLSTSPLV